MPDSSVSIARLFDPARPAPFVERLVQAVNTNSDLQRRGALCDVHFLLGIGEAAFHLQIVNGRIADAQAGPILMRSWQFAIKADADTWTQFWQPDAGGWLA